MTEKTKDYIKPQITRIGHPLFTKHGHSPSAQLPTCSEIDGVSIAELVNQFGSPLFVFSEQAIVDQYQRMVQAFRTRYSQVTLGWSYKTNYLRGICSLFHQLGSWAEVVSDFEYERARSLGVPGHRIIYNGPFKTIASLEQAAREGARVHIESFDELRDLEEIAQRHQFRPKVGIRINLNCGISPNWTRFGFNLEGGQAWQAIERIQRENRLDLVGLHTHIGTFILDCQAYQVAALKLCELAKKIRERFQLQIRYLDLGGGFPSLNRLKGIYQPPEVAIPKIDAYAEAITSALKKEFPGDSGPELVLESGRHMIDDAGHLVSSVTSSKLLPDGRRAYILDAGVNMLYTSTWYKPRIALDGAELGLAAPSALLGPLCMNIDVLDESLMLPRLERGKKLVFHPVGAYNVTQWMQFIQYRPAVVLIRKNKKVDILRIRENLEMMDLCERLPPDLILPI